MLGQAAVSGYPIRANRISIGPIWISVGAANVPPNVLPTAGAPHAPPSAIEQIYDENRPPRHDVDHEAAPPLQPNAPSHTPGGDEYDEDRPPITYQTRSRPNSGLGLQVQVFNIF